MEHTSFNQAQGNLIRGLLDYPGYKSNPFPWLIFFPVVLNTTWQVNVLRICLLLECQLNDKRMFALFAQPLAQCLTHSRNSVFVNEQMNEWPTSLRKWLTLERGRLPKYPWLFLNPVTFGSTKAVVNVLPCYKMSWVHTIVTVSSACACRNVMCTHTGTWGLEARTGFKGGNERGHLETSISEH